jgi:hypothetical protein
MSPSTSTGPQAARVDHVVVPLATGEGFHRAASLALGCGSRRARRLTLLLVSGDVLDSLDQACRQLAALLRNAVHLACEVRLVVRASTLAIALDELLRRDPADLVLVPPQPAISEAVSAGAGCPVLSLDPTAPQSCA